MPNELLSQRAYSSVANCSASISLNSFKDNYFKTKQPVILKGYFSQLAAMNKWPEHDFAALHRYGDVLVPVELSAGSASYTSTAETFEQVELPLAQFLTFLSHARSSAEQGIPLGDVKVYLAQHALFDTIPELYVDCTLPSFTETNGKRVPALCMAGRGDLYNINVWLGYATHTPLHRDPYCNIFAQLFGSKRAILFPPEAREYLKMHQNPLHRNTSTINDVFNVEAQRSLPINVQTQGLECSLESGDALYVPEGWLHSFKGSPGMSGSVNWWFR
ncbi:hypothetical protein BCR37DRAFT_384984 [Protomyces lactucae-debilis]|uniref:JmjC domain-containing protein n=1 Tax=Protomyces lactucae-debilis TaxID=2754530 RepID=A0A1Y2FVU7_PROLT|nr:uncharacterized protein BCR37DRAFT_384984 [Protomyces lactucae-debilis]ORY87677.1 hypothetical protein BCR37DRAFT_384984 [Protomyces lactucae-debilis]